MKLSFLPNQLIGDIILIVEGAKAADPDHVLKYSEDDALNTAITFDEDLNKLQSSLLRYHSYSLL